jgi:hypothetical protein
LASRPDDEDEALTIRYLLGTLAEPDQVRLEESFFADDERYEQMLAIEDELMYAYLQGELSSEDSTRFEQRFLRHPAGRRRAQFAGALLRAAAGVPPVSAKATVRTAQRAAPWWRGWGPHWEGRLALRAAVLALAALSGWLAYEAIDLRREGQRLLDARLAQERELQETAARHRQDRNDVAQARESERQARADLERLLADARGAESRGVVSLILASGLHRGEGESARLVIPSTVDLVRLQLDLGRTSDHATYRAVIRTAEGDQVWGRDGLRASPVGSIKAVIVDVPAKVLSRGDFELSLGGSTPAGKTEEVSDYYFSVRR